MISLSWFMNLIISIFKKRS